MKRLAFRIMLCAVISVHVHAQETSDADAEVQKLYEQIIAAYMDGDVEKLNEGMKAIRLKRLRLEPGQRKTLTDIGRIAPTLKPSKWWDNTMSPKNVSFKAEIWGRPFVANYMPTETLGVQAVMPEHQMDRNGQLVITKLNVIVSWRPNYVNKPDMLGGELATRHDLRVRHLGELIVWHELGHNYVTSFLPMKHVIALYSRERMAFEHLQEFFADLTSLYHSTPKAALATLFFRLDLLDFYDEMEPHTRAAHGIGSLLLAEVLENPDDWPNVHLPPNVPDKQTELNTIIYMVENIDPKWSPQEAMQLRKLVYTFLKRNGNKTLSTGGSFPLPGRNKFSLMVAQDREQQTHRDEWVAKKLEALIKSGRADKIAEGEKIDWPQRGKNSRRLITYFINDGKVIKKSGAPRLEIPW